jgi:hypothetical protein
MIAEKNSSSFRADSPAIVAQHKARFRESGLMFHLAA